MKYFVFVTAALLACTASADPDATVAAVVGSTFSGPSLGLTAFVGTLSVIIAVILEQVKAMRGQQQDYIGALVPIFFFLILAVLAPQVASTARSLASSLGALTPAKVEAMRNSALTARYERSEQNKKIQDELNNNRQTEAELDEQIQQIQNERNGVEPDSVDVIVGGVKKLGNKIANEVTFSMEDFVGDMASAVTFVFYEFLREMSFVIAYALMVLLGAIQKVIFLLLVGIAPLVFTLAMFPIGPFRGLVSTWLMTWLEVGLWGFVATTFVSALSGALTAMPTTSFGIADVMGNFAYVAGFAFIPVAASMLTRGGAGQMGGAMQGMGFAAGAAAAGAARKAGGAAAGASARAAGGTLGSSETLSKAAGGAAGAARGAANKALDRAGGGLSVVSSGADEAAKQSARKLHAKRGAIEKQNRDK